MDNKDQVFVEAEFGDLLMEVSLSIGAYRGTDYIASGTATFIAPFLAITAKHVIEHYWREFETTSLKNGKNDEPRVHNSKFKMIGVQMPVDGKERKFWDVKQVFGSGGTDIAYLSLVPRIKLDKNHVWRLPEINLLPPKINTTILAFGYTKSKACMENGNIKWDYDPRRSQGKVLDIHQIKRDNFSINFPSIYTDARFDPGMSGGPVFNQLGELCGVISSNLPPSAEGEQHASYAALIWASLSTPLQVRMPGMTADEIRPVLDLCKHGYIKAANHDKVRLFDSELGKNTKISLSFNGVIEEI